MFKGIEAKVENESSTMDDLFSSQWNDDSNAKLMQKVENTRGRLGMEEM